MAILTRPRAGLGFDEEALIKEARHLRRRRWLLGVAVVLLAGALIAGLVVVLAAGASAPPHRAGGNGASGFPSSPSTGSIQHSGDLTEVVRGVFPDKVFSLQQVSCPSSALCVAMGESGFDGRQLVLRTTNLGRTWSTTQMPSGTPALLGESCPTSNVCVAVGKSLNDKDVAFLRSDDGGTSWTTQSIPLAEGYVYGSVSCWSSNGCIATLSPSDTSDLMFGPPPPPPLQFVTSDGGASWTSSSPFKALKSILIAGVSCVAPGTCEAAGSAIDGPWAARTSDGGSTWSRQSLPVVRYTEQPTSISCATASFCEIALSEGIYAGTYATRNGGDSWSFHLDHTFGSQPASIDCLATGTCYLGGFWAGSKVTSLGLLEVTNDFGDTWTRMRVPPSTTGVDSVACVSSTSCLLLSTDYGGTAAVLNVAGPEVIEPGASLEQWFRTGGLSCSTASHCIAVGNAASRTGQVAEVEVTRNGGRTWIAHQALSLPSGLVDVVCPTPLHCIAVGWEATITINGVIVVSSNGGVTWRFVHQTTGIDNQVNAVACSSTTICTAVGSKDIVLRTTDGGLRWAKQALPLQGVSPGVGLTSISCPSADRCVAEGRDLGNNGGYAFSTDNGGTTWTTSTYAWLTPSEARDVSWMAGLACPTTKDCVAVTGSVEFSFAERSADGGSVWSRLKLPAGPVDVRSIGCHDSWCVATAVSEKKAVLLSSVNGGSSWRVVTGPTGTSSLSNASCGPSSCWVSGVAKVSGATEIVELIRPGSSSTKKVGIR